MAISIANITSGSALAATSATSASITLNSSKLELVDVISRTAITANPNQPTMTGDSLTWVAVNSVVYDDTSSSRKRITVFRSMGTPASGVLTIDFGGQIQTDIAWIVDELSGTDTSGTNGSGAIVQSVTNFDDTATTGLITATLAAFSSADNSTYGAFGEGNGSTWTVGSGFTKMAEVTSGLNITAMTEFKVANDTTVDATDGANSELGAIAIEIKVAVVASTVKQLAALGVG